MKWLMLPTDYFTALADVSDAAEVMFTRGLDLAAEMDSGGVIPLAVLHWLTRHHRRAGSFAAELVDAGLWMAIDGGYQIVNWHQFAAPRSRAHIPTAVRLAIYARDGWKCVQCGAMAPLSLDHIWPWSLGGSDRPENLQTLCMPCNLRKGASTS